MRLSFFILSIALLLGCGKDSSYSPEHLADFVAPDSFLFKVETNRGDIQFEAIRAWSPKGVDRLYHLIEEGYYDSTYIFRVQSDYVTQFGIANKPAVSQYWRKHPIEDEPVRKSNFRGSLSFARDGKNSRDTQLFINLCDNPKLDTIEFMGLRGFPPIGKIVGDSSWATLERLNDKHGFDPANHQEEMYREGNSYIEKAYPDLDVILKVSLMTQPE